MTGEADHGPRLTGEEYDKRVVALQGKLPPAPSREQERQVRRAELDLAIDYRLGRNFPQERRNALWAVQQRIERRRLATLARYLVRRLFRKSLIPEARGLAGYVVDQYATVLNSAELSRYFGDEEVGSPMLPVDETRI